MVTVVVLCHSKENQDRLQHRQLSKMQIQQSRYKRATTTAQPPLTTTGGNCTACFDPLNATQKSELLIALSDDNFIPPTTTTIAELCEVLGGLSSTDLLNAAPNNPIRA